MKEYKKTLSLGAIVACFMLLIVGCSSNADIPEGWSKGDNNVYSGIILGFDNNESIIYITDMSSPSSVVENLSTGTAVSVITEEIGVVDMAIKDSVKFKIDAYKSYPPVYPKTGLDAYVVCSCKISVIDYQQMR
jgi:hypothetical protein